MKDIYRSTSLDELLKLAASQELVLPNFQRDFVWDRDGQRKLVSSFLVNIPVGSVLVLNGHGEQFASRQLCLKEPDEVFEGECKYLLDGQQRVSTLKSVFVDLFEGDWYQSLNDLFPPLQNRWLLRIRPEQHEEVDPFGWRSLRFERGTLSNLDPAEIEDFLVCKKIFVKDTEKWYNPQYEQVVLKGAAPNERKLTVAKEAAPQAMVPLYRVWNRNGEKKPLHEYVLNRIAKEREDQLRAQVEDRKISLVEVLRPADPDIKEYVADDDDDAINQTWMKLRTEWASGVQQYLESLPQQPIACIWLESDEVNRAIPIFENLNRQGTPLSVFDLVVARAALADPTGESLTTRLVGLLSEERPLPQSLRKIVPVPDRWSACEAGAVDREGNIASFTKNQFLNLLSLFSYFKYGSFSREVGVRTYELNVDYIKRKQILDLTSEQINDHLGVAAIALSRAVAFLQHRCGLVQVSDLKYDLMVLPIAYVFSNDEAWDSKWVHDRVEYWYWSSFFGGSYRERQNRQCIYDLQALYAWVAHDTDDPFSVRFEQVLDAPQYSDRATLLMENAPEVTPPDAMRAGVLQYVLSLFPEDLLPAHLFEQIRLSAWQAATEQELHSKSGDIHTVKLEAHHICPVAGAATLGKTSSFVRNNKSHLLNSPLNLTYVSATANRLLRDLAVDKYVSFLSTLAPLHHLLPSANDLKQEEGEAQDDYYHRVIDRRFEKLREAVLKELDDLRASSGG